MKTITLVMSQRSVLDISVPEEREAPRPVHHRMINGREPAARHAAIGFRV
jgi:hypothetical protein